MVDFKREKGESFENFLRRFNKGLQQTRKLQEVRGRQHLEKKKNKRKQKEYALHGIRLRKKTEYLRKIGKLKEEPRKRW